MTPCDLLTIMSVLSLLRQDRSLIEETVGQVLGILLCQRGDDVSVLRHFVELALDSFVASVVLFNLFGQVVEEASQSLTLQEFQPMIKMHGCRKISLIYTINGKCY